MVSLRWWFAIAYPVYAAALVMLLLAACAWLLAGLHEGDWWQATPSMPRSGAAIAAVLAYAGLVAAFLRRGRARDRSAKPAAVAARGAVWVVHASQTGFAMELADMTAAALRRGGVSVQRAGLEHLDAPRLQDIERAVFVVSHALAHFQHVHVVPVAGAGEFAQLFLFVEDR